MSKTRITKIADLGTIDGLVGDADSEHLMKLPSPYDNPEWEPHKVPLKESIKEKYESSLDGYLAIGIPKPKTKEEEEKLTKQFLSGVSKLFSEKDNWTFLQPLLLTMDYCARCNVCSDACPIYLSTGRQEIYRPTYRAEVLRRIYKRYFTRAGKTLGKFYSGDFKLNWNTVSRLAELSYRCTLCRRCAQVCPIGADNGLVTHEIRKLFSQEMGIAAKELHEKGTVQQLKVGASTGMNKKGFLQTVKFMEEEIKEITGKTIKIPVDEKKADIMLIHNAGEFLSWPENPTAFAIIFEEAGLSWTLSSEAYDGVNYGVWYDDMQLARVASMHIEAAKKLDVNRIVVGECGHAHKAITVIADRVFPDGPGIPRESCLPILWDIVRSGKLNLDPEKNDFPVTLHDPCNIVRLMGIVEPQRNVLKQICPFFREMTPKGVYNYCCGGGSGFAIMNSFNFPEWKGRVSTRMKMKQVIDAFSDTPDPRAPKYICAPCSNCKGALRDMLGHYKATERMGMYYGGLVDLIVNAMVDTKKPLIGFDST